MRGNERKRDSERVRERERESVCVCERERATWRNCNKRESERGREKIDR